ncbi:unnamed protein product [Cyprideis torosa]|uniref:non-specific serine/threonine protein kinase n=1 Tax=Cyprideis torosa TaxID=163714 RepID=A0A7R8W9F8_9CRUS|nr:unnamed protein product [Cyprideis torosa]CAG0884330.1 unnamed protein product [Cyprideis torosa]
MLSYQVKAQLKTCESQVKACELQGKACESQVKACELQVKACESQVKAYKDDTSPRSIAHEKLGEVLRILRNILEKYPPLQSTELLMAAGALIQQVKGFSYEDVDANPAEFFEAIDLLALSFSSRVSEYLMGDLDSASSVVSSKTKSCDNILGLEDKSEDGKEPEGLSHEQTDAVLLRLEQGVEYALHRAKVWAKYAKDVMAYVEKRALLELEYSRNLAKLAQSMKPALKEESYLPFQSVYCTALDQDVENCANSQRTTNLIQGHKFLEVLRAHRTANPKDLVVIKLEAISVSDPQLETEFKIMKKMEGKEGFPEVYHFGLTNNARYRGLVVELLGENLQELFRRSGHNFPQKLVVQVTIQLLRRMRDLHEAGFVYRDVKPENVVCGLGFKRGLLYLIDFGLVNNWRKSVTGGHVDQNDEEGGGIVGTTRYMSIHSHNGLRQSRRDDLESLFYVVVYLLRGSLPWQSLGGGLEPSNKNRLVLDCKMSNSVEELCKGFPQEFVNLGKVARNLGFAEAPPYDSLSNGFQQLAVALSVGNDEGIVWPVMSEGDSSVTKSSVTGTVSTSARPFAMPPTTPKIKTNSAVLEATGAYHKSKSSVTEVVNKNQGGKAVPISASPSHATKVLSSSTMEDIQTEISASPAPKSVSSSSPGPSPLSSRRFEHEKKRKNLKETWTREVKRMQDAVTNLRKARMAYVTRQQELVRAREATMRLRDASGPQEEKEAAKKRRVEDEAVQREFLIPRDKSLLCRSQIGLRSNDDELASSIAYEFEHRIDAR